MDSYINLHSSARRQEAAIILVVVVPALFSPLIALVYFFYFGATILDLIVFFVFYCIAAVGITVGYHRYFTHRSFSVGKHTEKALAIMGYSAGQGPVCFWVANHRLHHASADTHDDPHSPLDTNGRLTFHSFIHAHLLWIFSSRKVNIGRFGRDLLKNRRLVKMDSQYIYYYILFLIAPGIIELLITFDPIRFFSGVVYGGLLRQFFVLNMAYSINSLCHSWGHQPNALPNNSRNVLFLSVASFGESLHNNHHYAPTSPNFSVKNEEIDPGFAVIKIMQWFGIADLGARRDDTLR